MKQLQFNQMENVQGGDNVGCLALATDVMIATIETGVGALLGGIITWSACSLLSK